MTNAAVENPEHPAPHRQLAGTWKLGFAVLGAPLAWATEQIVNYVIVSHACAPGRGAAATDPDFGAVRLIDIAINILGVAVALAATITAWRIWRAVRREVEGDDQALVDVGEGRTRFIAMWGLAGGVYFTAAALTTTAALVLTPVCQ